jgi:hypothetical protein
VPDRTLSVAVVEPTLARTPSSWETNGRTDDDRTVLRGELSHIDHSAV